MNPWEVLFDRAISIIHTVEKNAGGSFPWRFGGGTVLMLRYAHRKSKDIDIFVRDVQLLTWFSPRVNDIDGVEDYTERSNFVKISFPEGEVDFVVAPTLTENPFYETEIHGVPCCMESPDEIVIKKLFYRAESLKVRDLVDLAVVLQDPGNQLSRYNSLLLSKQNVLKNRIYQLSRVYKKQVEEIEFSEKGRFLKEIALDMSQEFVAKIGTKQYQESGQPEEGDLSPR
mgnify:CR=1 FL=1